MMKKRKVKKSTWVPLALTLYSAVLYAYLLPGSTESAASVTAVIAANVLVIVALWWLYRKKEKLAEKRDREWGEQRNKKEND